VAAAANLTEVAQALGSEFEKQARIHAVFSFGSTAQLTTQIENSAPFDVFLAADAGHVDKLASEHLLVRASDAVYAIGVLALWIPPGSQARLDNVADLAAKDVHTIAVANPKLAPYGAATVETLQHAGIWERVKDKIVYAENINMAREYGTSKNADAVFTAYSLVLKERGKVIQVDESMHQPIVQKLGVIASSRHRDEAQAFANFVLHGGGRAILVRYGYQVH
jgi:molybdate transport system substrate-binding protein